MKSICIVSGEEYESTPDTLKGIYNGQEYEVCCQACLEAFNENPEKYIN